LILIQTTFELPAWSRDSISALCPDLDFVAPELADGTKCDSQVDIFSLGVLAFATFNRGKPLFNSQNSFACYSKHFEQLDQQRLGQLLAVVPADLRQDVKMCLNQTPELRPDAIQFTKVNLDFSTISSNLSKFDLRQHNSHFSAVGLL
jgi:serine/threonine protein kinase